MKYDKGEQEGRLQIIRNLKKHYDEMYSMTPRSYAPNCFIGISLPESTLHKYFKELEGQPRRKFEPNR